MAKHDLPADLAQKIDGLVARGDVVLFMKGVRRMPQCGFSARVVQILDSLGVTYTTHNVLTDPELREALKVYSDWPTFPQLFFRGELVGGCDVVSQLAQTGELQKALGIAN
jgi:monothiol glutaredoxin